MFFGIIRQSCGESGHPMANQFFYAYGLLSVKSLIKPSHGASVSTEPVQVLGCTKAPHYLMQPSRTEFIEQHGDAMLQNGDSDTESDDIMDLELSVECIDDITNDSKPDKTILFYLGGYVAHKLQRFSSCIDCLQFWVHLKQNQMLNLLS